MAERNLCTESGCKAYCCLDMILHFDELSSDQLLAYWPTAQKTWSIYWRSYKEDGVFYSKSGKGFDIRIKGYCPNLTEGFNCKLQSDKPEACGNAELGHSVCRGGRLGHALPTFQEWAYQKWMEEQRELAEQEVLQ